MENKKEIINKYFDNIRKKNSKVDSFFAFLDNNEIHYAILGGFVRAALNDDSSPRDIDIIFKEKESHVENYLIQNNIAFKKNTFDGLKFNLNNLQFDVWKIEDHFAFRKKIYKPQFENIYKTTFLNYDSIMYDVTEQILYCKNYQHCIDKQLIDFVGNRKLNKKNPNLELSICKIFEICKNEKLLPSVKIKKYIKKYYDEYVTEKIFMNLLQSAYEDHYNKKMNKDLSCYIKRELKKIRY